MLDSRVVIADCRQLVGDAEHRVGCAGRVDQGSASVAVSAADIRLSRHSEAGGWCIVRYHLPVHLALSVDFPVPFRSLSQLPTEYKRFTTVDKNWRNTLSSAKSSPLAIKFCANEKLLERFQESNKFLDLVHRGLANYLETKREAFPRFYFLSDDEMLEVCRDACTVCVSHRATHARALN